MFTTKVKGNIYCVRCCVCAVLLSKFKVGHYGSSNSQVVHTVKHFHPGNSLLYPMLIDDCIVRSVMQSKLLHVHVHIILFNMLIYSGSTHACLIKVNNIMIIGRVSLYF